tara:strand:- start:18602 stop:21085 length:2484 start_codon:yes stop_codon:yes gene_type:complete
MRLCAIVFFFGVPLLWAQFPAPSLTNISPQGGKAGTEFRVALTGTDLDQPELRFTHPGISASPVLLPADEIWPEARQDGLKFLVKIDANVPAGLYEARVVGKFGVSTPRMFMVSSNSGSDEIIQGGGNESVETAKEIALEQYVSATIPANGSDYYKVAAKKGQRVLVHCWAGRIDSRMDASLSIMNSKGELIAAAHDSVGRDPLADFLAPEDGAYIIKVNDFLYLGGANHFYRLVASIKPHLDAVFPLAALPGTTKRFTVYGRNLPQGSLGERIEKDGVLLETAEIEVSVPEQSEPRAMTGLKPMRQLVDGFNFSIPGSNSVRVGFAESDVVHEDSQIEEQAINWPCEVAGRFDFPGDSDFFRFSAKKDQSLWIGVLSDRVSVSTDPNLTVEQVVRAADETETFKILKEVDDFAIQSSVVGFDSRTFDGGMLFTVPADGEYRVRVRNNFGSYGPLQSYQLAIREARPRFQLIAIADSPYQEARTADPGTPFLNAGGTASIRVIALRLDGFDGPIDISASGLPDGVTALKSQIWKGATETRLILSAGDSVKDSNSEVKITGTAGSLVDDAQFGTLRWGARDYSRERLSSRLTSTFPLRVSSQPAPLSLALKEEKTWEVEIQKQLDLPITLTKAKGIKGNVTVIPYGLPNFNRPPSINIAEKDNEGTLKISFRVDGNNKPMVSEGSFLLQANGVMGKYRTNPEEVDKWTHWQKAITENAKKLAEAKTHADAEVRKTAEALSLAQKNLAAATAESKPELEKTVAGAESKSNQAKAVAAKAAELVKQAEAAKKVAAAELKKASDRAKERDVKFTVFSPPISLRITAPPEKK